MQPDTALVSMAVFLPIKYEADFAKLCKEWYNEDDLYYNHLTKLRKVVDRELEHSTFQRSQTHLCRLLRQYEGTLKEDRMIQQEALNV